MSYDDGGGATERDDCCPNVDRGGSNVAMRGFAAVVLLLGACGGGGDMPGGSGAAGGSGTAAPQFVFEAPGIPGSGVVQELYTARLDGTGLMQITHDGLTKFLPHFSPDGKRILYSEFVVGQYGDPHARVDLMVHDLATATETRLTSDGQSIQGAWSSDGQRIVFGAYSNNGMSIMNADGSGRHLVGQPSGAPDDQVWGRLRLVERRLDPVHGGAEHRRLLQGPASTRSAPTAATEPRSPMAARIARPPAWNRTAMPTRASAPTARRSSAHAASRRRRPDWRGARSGACIPSRATPGRRARSRTISACRRRRTASRACRKARRTAARVLVYRICDGEPHSGVTLTDTAGFYRTWVIDGFGADWNPVTP